MIGAPDDPATTRAFLRAHSPYDRMEAADLEALAGVLHAVRFAAGEAITDPAAGPAQTFYVLRDGRVIGAGEIEDESIDGNAWELVPGECFPVGALAAERPVRSVQRAEGAVVCLAMARADYAAMRRRSGVFDAYCANRLAGLVERVGRQVRAEAQRGIGSDRSLDGRLSARDFRPPITAPPEMPIREVLGAMSAARVGSTVVVDPAGRPMGIFTLKDLMNRVALGGRSFDAPISSAMTPDPVSVQLGAFAFEAAVRMADRGIQHLCVLDGDRLVGVISERDLFSMQRIGPAMLGKAIAAAEDVAGLARQAQAIHALVAQMQAVGANVGQVTAIITALNDRIAERVIALVRAEDDPGLPFTWLAFGSEGRQEQTLKTDQDNGILFEPQAEMDLEVARDRLMSFALRVNHALDACGFSLCTGGIMASNPDCCLSAAEWHARFTRWIDQGTPEHLLKASIFFDLRTIDGAQEPVEALRASMLTRTAANTRFQRQMAANALGNAPPLGRFRAFRLSGSGEQAASLDLKFGGVTPFVDAARILALARGLPATNTGERLSGTVESGGLDPQDAAAFRDAYDYIRLLRMRINQEQAAAGEALSNRVFPARLNDLDRRILREAFREAKQLQAKIALDYQL